MDGAVREEDSRAIGTQASFVALRCRWYHNLPRCAEAFHRSRRRAAQASISTSVSAKDDIASQFWMMIHVSIFTDA